MAEMTWTVESEGGKKGRKFSARGLGLLAPRGGYQDPMLPWWLSFACEEGALRPLLANVLTGRTLDIGSGKAACKRSTPYVYRLQRLPDGVHVVIVYQPSLFDIEAPPEGSEEEDLVRFALLPDSGWTARAGMTPAEMASAWDRARSVDVADEELARRWRYAVDRDVPLAKALGRKPDPEAVSLAVLLGAHLDHRLRVPLLPDVGFYLHLLRVLYVLEYAIQPARQDRWVWRADDRAGYLAPTVVLATVEHLEAAVVAAITSYIPSE